MMDPFDEFEFKPITDGLGFHKKQNEKSSGKSAFSAVPGISPALDFSTEVESNDELLPPLPRKKILDAPISIPGQVDSKAVDEVLKNLKKDKRLDFTQEARSTELIKKTPTTSASTETAKNNDKFLVVPFATGAYFLDALLILSSSLLCMIILLAITKVDLIQNLTSSQTDPMVFVATLALFASVSFIYLTVNRAFLGHTPGEWAFELRLGLPSQMKSAFYPAKVALRSLIAVVTGFVILPIASWVLNQDVIGDLSGVKRFKKITP
ncbi:MAG: RDD family protein [Pseudobdellovibrionaceae bacterium]